MSQGEPPATLTRTLTLALTLALTLTLIFTLTLTLTLTRRALPATYAAHGGAAAAVSSRAARLGLTLLERDSQG